MLEILGFIAMPKDFNLEWSVKAFLSHFALGYIFSFFFYLGIIRLFIPWSRDVFSACLCVAFWGAWISVGIDLDHVVMLFGKEYGRPWHKPIGVIAAAIATFTFARLIRWRLDKSFDHVNEIGRVKRNLLWCVLASCLVLHVLEDYLLGWF